MDQLRVPIANETGSIISMRFQEFLQNFQKPVEGEELTQQRFLNDYLLQIQNMIHCNKSTVYVDFLHLKEVDTELAEAIELEYYQFEPYLRHAIHNIVMTENPQFVYDVDKGQREFFVSFYNLPKIEHIRQVKTEKIGRLISISGTVTRTSEVRPELLYGYFLCRHCATAYPNVEQQFQYTEPIICKNPQCSTKAKSFEFVLDKSTFIDWQRLRVQENADEIPPGSMPRCLDVICRNECVEVAKAGDKIVITGAVSVLPDTSGLSRAGESTISSRSSMTSEFNDGVGGLKQLGVKEMTYKMIFVACSVQLTDQRTGKASTNNILPYYSEMNQAMNAGFVDNEETIQFSDSELRRMEEMFKTPDLYTRMAESICPTVYGHMEVKRGILLMLLGGVHKKTLEGISLRGDLNICIVGDPSCAKSQFLKYVHGFLPRTIYTSGKSSSAAGLTASVVRDAETGEFCVEAGALMLADNGICCIDEFDKMDATDQVAIHEAMEQQTISITKAGIQATLNARTSILAAANPVFGRYDRTKTLKANIAVSAAIMSRFDLFFVILDECNPQIDNDIARHIIKNHKAGGMKEAASNAPFSREDLQKYIAFARTIHPEFSEGSRSVLVDCYRLLRQNDMLGKNKTAYRITVRQLESLVRLSEALARLHWDVVVREAYVREAYRLLQRSIIFIETEDVEIDDDEGPSTREDIHAMDIAAMEQENIATNLISTRQQESQSYQAAMETEIPPQDSSEPQQKTTEKKKSKQDLKIPQAEYAKLARIIALRLKTLEDDDPAGDSKGVLWKDLAQWVYEQFEKELQDEEAHQRKKKVIYQVIRRMIKHEGAIIVMNIGEEATASLANEDKYLKIHPSSSYLDS